MQRARQGVDVAVHCDEALLSTGALLDFRAHVEGLLARGDRAGALALWESVVVFIHEPPIPDAEFVIGHVHGVSKVEGVSVSRGSGFGLAAVFWPSLEHPAKVWSGYHARLERLDLLLLAPLASGRAQEDFLPEHGAVASLGGCLPPWWTQPRGDFHGLAPVAVGAALLEGTNMNRSWDSPVAGQRGPGERSGTGWVASPAALNFSHTRNDRSVCPDCSSNFGLGSS